MKMKVRSDDVETYYLDDGPFSKSVEVPEEFFFRFVGAMEEFWEVQELLNKYFREQRT